jgi:hypothetical protein
LAGGHGLSAAPVISAMMNLLDDFADQVSCLFLV